MESCRDQATYFGSQVESARMMNNGMASPRLTPNGMMLHNHQEQPAMLIANHGLPMASNQCLPPQAFAFPANVDPNCAAQASFPVAPLSPPGTGVFPHSFQSTSEWNGSPDAASLMNSNSDSSPDLSSDASVHPFDQVHSGRAIATNGLGFSEFVSPMELQRAGQPTFDFGMAFGEEDSGVGPDGFYASHMMNQAGPSSLPSPPGHGGGEGSPKRPYQEMVTEPASPPSDIPLKSEPEMSSQPTKRTRKGGNEIQSHGDKSNMNGNTASATAALAAAAAAADKMSKNRLRSASRTSKNTHHRPAETAEERRSRNSHNMVEKQYRNRLNAQFESLLNSLPDHRSSGSGADDDSDGGGAADLGEKRVSKAEVLDMARRHIKSLERENQALAREKTELLGNVERLREVAYGRAGAAGLGVQDATMEDILNRRRSSGGGVCM